MFQIAGSVPALGWDRTWIVVMGFTPSRNWTALNPWPFARFHNLSNSELSLRLSISVVIASQYEIYVNHADSDAILPPIHRIAIWSLFGKLLRKRPRFWRSFTATQRIVVRSQIWERQVKERLKLHFLSIYDIVLWSQLKYFIGAKVQISEYDELLYNIPAQKTAGFCPVPASIMPKQITSAF